MIPIITKSQLPKMLGILWGLARYSYSMGREPLILQQEGQLSEELRKVHRKCSENE
jgi:hypothetical protein